MNKTGENIIETYYCDAVSINELETLVSGWNPKRRVLAMSVNGTICRLKLIQNEID